MSQNRIFQKFFTCVVELGLLAEISNHLIADLRPLNQDDWEVVLHSNFDVLNPLMALAIAHQDVDDLARRVAVLSIVQGSQ